MMYKPVVPQYVADMVEKTKHKHNLPIWDRELHSEDRKKFKKWLSSYSRKWKYALLNGYIVKNESSKNK